MSSTYSTTVQTVSVCGIDYRIRSLKDLNQFCDSEQIAATCGISSATWPLFGVIWPAGLILAEIIGSYALTETRILELGCGLGIASLVAQSRGADITASDHHPLAESFMKINAGLNNLNVPHFVRCDWANPEVTLGTFDLIIGSDLLYERAHPQLLSNCIDRHANPPAAVIIVDPGRHQHGKFVRRMNALGFRSKASRISVERHSRNFKGHILVFFR